MALKRRDLELLRKLGCGRSLRGAPFWRRSTAAEHAAEVFPLRVVLTAPAWVLFLAFGLASYPLQADYLRTAEGRLHNGRFDGIAGDRYRFDTGAGAVLIPIAGAELHIGVRGVPGCIRFFAVKAPDCSAFVFSVSAREVIIGFPRTPHPDFTAARLATGSLESILVQKPEALPEVERGMKVRVRVAGVQLEGAWQGAQGDTLHLLVKNKLRDLRLAEIAELVIVAPPADIPPPEISERDAGKVPLWLWGIPGGPALKRGDTLRGALVGASAIGFGTAALLEFRQVENVARDARRDPLFLYFDFLGLTDYEGNYRRHVIRHRSFSALALLSFAYHFWDTYTSLSGARTQPAGALLRFFWEPLPQITQGDHPAVGLASRSVGFRIGFAFRVM